MWAFDVARICALLKNVQVKVRYNGEEITKWIARMNFVIVHISIVMVSVLFS